MTSVADDRTLDELRLDIAPRIARHAAFDGWTPAGLASAAAELGVSSEIAALAFPGGAVDMIDAWFAGIDDAMRARWSPEAVAALKIRDRIQTLVECRIDLILPDREALRRALALLALPSNAFRATRLGWRTADAIWRLAGDTATDFNHYSKRTMLLGIYAATMLVLIDDESEGQADTRAFLARRIGDVMRIERTKARLGTRAERLPSLSRFVGRLRYPAT